METEKKPKPPPIYVADDTAILAPHENSIVAFRLLQDSLDQVQLWLKTWRIKANETKSVNVTFTNRKEACPTVSLNGLEVPQSSEAKYLGMHLDRQLIWKKHIFTKRKQLGIQLLKLYWLIGCKSQLSLENKFLLYKSILKPVWSYGIQLWGTASNSNIEILQRFQAKMFQITTDAPWYVINQTLHRDLNIRTAREEIKHHSTNYNDRLGQHPNALAAGLMTERVTQRLKKIPQDLII